MKLTFLILLILPAFIFSTANANNYHIPNYYKNRRAPNLFSSVAWSDRREAGLNVAISNGEYEPDDPTLSSNESEGLDIEGHLFYKLNDSVNLEFYVKKGDSETTSVGSTSIENEKVIDIT